MVNELEELVTFCKNYKKLICYGAGNYGYTVNAFLKEKEIELDGFCISDSQLRKTEKFLEKPVRYISEVQYNETDYGVIISINDKYHNQIEKNLQEKGIRNYFKITQSRIEAIISAIGKQKFEKHKLLDLVRYNLPDVSYDLQEKNKYEEKIEMLRNQFKRIEVRYLHGYNIGGSIAEFIYYQDFLNNENNHFMLLYTKNVEPLWENEFKEPNTFFLERFKDKSFEALTMKNMAFWKYFIEFYPEIFIANIQHTYFGTVIPKQVEAFRENKFHQKKEKYLNFDKKEIYFGDNKLKEMSVKRKFLCFFSRDPRYYKEVLKENAEILDVMDSYRNSDIKNFEMMTQYFDEYYKMSSIRMGMIADGYVNGKGVIDYASKYRSEFMDFYLINKCEFFISDPSGIILLASLVSKPLVLINMPLVTVHNDGFAPMSPKRDLMVFQKYWDRTHNKYLTFKEMMELENCAQEEYKYSGTTKIFEKYYGAGLVPIKNTPQEIMDVALEMKMKVEGTMKYDEEDEMLQKKFRKMVENQIKNYEDLFWYDARVGAKFLKQNKWLLD